MGAGHRSKWEPIKGISNLLEGGFLGISWDALGCSGMLWDGSRCADDCLTKVMHVSYGM